MHSPDRRIRAAAALAWGALVGCAPPAPAGTLAQPPTCPRDALVEAGRCTCLHDRVLVLGACVEHGVRDGYCGPAALPSASGPGEVCAFRTCAGTEALDTTGDCVPVGTVARSGPRCEPPGTLAVTGGHAACVPPDAACPRGTFAEGDSCRAPTSCPAGALWTGKDCRPVVTRGPRGPTVDLGAWTALAIGVSGGPGSPELCRPLESSPLAFELARGDRIELRLAISVSVPDQDVSRVFASVRAEGGARGQSHPLTPAAQAQAQRLAAHAVATMVEALRGLGGESSTAAVEVEVRCTVASL
jgi:hypothetical protein